MKTDEKIEIGNFFPTNKNSGQFQALAMECVTYFNLLEIRDNCLINMLMVEEIHFNGI